MGQQSLNIKDRSSVLGKVHGELLSDADNKYMKDHFLVGEKVDMDKVKHNFLIEYALCTTNCEVIDWVWYKINGALPNEKEQTFDILPEKTNINIYNITKFVKEESNWSEIQW